MQLTTANSQNAIRKKSKKCSKREVCNIRNQFDKIHYLFDTDSIYWFILQMSAIPRAGNQIQFLLEGGSNPVCMQSVLAPRVRGQAAGTKNWSCRANPGALQSSQCLPVLPASFSKMSTYFDIKIQNTYFRIMFLVSKTRCHSVCIC